MNTGEPFVTVSAAVGLVLLLLVYRYIRSVLSWRARTRGRPLPPGPDPLPLLGNVYNLPKVRAWEGYRDLCSKYGDIVHLEALGEHILVLGSPDVIFEYLEKRAANTSDRKQTVLLELTGTDFILAFMPYGQLWRRHRRAFWQYFHPTVSAEYKPIQRMACHKFVRRLLRDPSHFKDHIRYTFTAAMMKVLFNLEEEQDIEKLMEIVDLTQDGVSQGLVPGKFLVEFLPWLRYLPSYFLGTELREKSPKWTNAARFLKIAPFKQVKNAMMQDEAEGQRSVVGKLLQKIWQHGDVEDSSAEDEEDVIQNVAAVAVEGGSDTMYSTVQTMCLAMSLYPDILKKAHTELDAVVGPNRLPNFEDQDSLVYINAIIKESLRWQNVLPLSVPHATTADDEFRGYFIPAGTVLLPNIWACMHDPEVYESSDEYRPERFIRDGKIDPTLRNPFMFVFGFGRRICPGRHFAESSLFINIATILHVFDFSPPVDEHGKRIDIEPQMSDGLVSYPDDCRCAIKPRFAQAEALILEALRSE